MKKIDRDAFNMAAYAFNIYKSCDLMNSVWHTAIGLQAVDGLKTSKYF